MRTITRILSALIPSLLFVVGVHAQAALNGKVTSVVDGKTFVFETESGRLTGTIQYIDVPEPEQPLSRISREHFERLVLGQTISFIPSGYSPIALVGRMYLGGLDLGQQLVRDGAAWHLPAELSGQGIEEAKPYEDYQGLARAEKRGVWSISNLTPSWRFRLGKDRSVQDIDFVRTAITAKAGDDKKNYSYPSGSGDIWTEVGGEAFAQRNAAGELFWGYDAEKKLRNTSTPGIAQVISDGRDSLEVEIRTIYFQGEIKPRMPNTAFVIAILAESRRHNFDKNNILSFNADGSEIIIGEGQRFVRENPMGVEELLQYRISRIDLAKIAGSKKLSIRVGSFSSTADNVLRDAMSQLLRSAN